MPCHFTGYDRPDIHTKIFYKWQKLERHKKTRKQQIEREKGKYSKPYSYNTRYRSPTGGALIFHEDRDVQEKPIYGPDKTIFPKGVPVFSFFLCHFWELTRETKCSRIARARGIQSWSWTKNPWTMAISRVFLGEYYSEITPKCLKIKMMRMKRKITDDAQRIPGTCFVDKTQNIYVYKSRL